MKERNKLTAWDYFVLRHHDPSNLKLHFISMTMFFGSPVYGLATGDPWWFGFWCLSGCIGTWAHYATRDGTVTLHEATSSPLVVLFNVRMWWRLLIRRYAIDIARAEAQLHALTRGADTTVLITGCSSGFGRAMVREFLARGFTVLATVRQAEAADALSAEHEGSPLTVVLADVRQAEGRRRIMQLVQQAGRLDALVTNAGIGTFGALSDVSEAELREVMEVNFFGTALLARVLCPVLAKTKGTLVCVSSPAGVSGFPYTSAYCASKHAVAGLTESLYYEWAPRGVRVHLLTPSAHRTDFMRNAVWSERSTSPHFDAVQGYRSVMAKNQARELPEARNVAAIAAELVERSGYGFRVDVGVNVRVLRFMVRFWPDWLRQRLMLHSFARAARKREKRAEVQDAPAS